MSTTFDAPFEQAVAEYEAACAAKLPQLPACPDPADGKGLRLAKAVLARMVESSGQAKPVTFAFDFEGYIQSQVSMRREMYQGMVQKAQSEYERLVAVEVAAHDAEMQDAEAAANASISNLEKMYDELLTYRDKIQEAVIRYDIKPSDISIDEEALTRQDMEALLSDSIKACKHISSGGFRSKLSFLYTPLEDTSESRNFTLIAVVAGLVALAPIMFVSLFGYMLVNTWTINKYINSLRVADKLMFGINFQRFRDTSQLEAVKAVDDTAAQEKRAAILDHAKGADPELLSEQLHAEMRENFEGFAARIDEVTKGASRRWVEWCQQLNELKKQVDTLYDEFLANRVDFYDNQSLHYAMDYQAVVGLVDETVEVRQELFSQNLVFANNEQTMLDFIRLLLANIMLNIRPMQLDVTIYDPERLGQDYATFLRDECRDYVRVETKDLSNILDRLREYSKKNFAILDNSNIYDYNAEAERVQKVTLPYKLLLIAAPDSNTFKEPSFQQYMATSVRTGVHVWVVNPAPLEGCKFFAAPFDGVQDPYPVTQEVIATAMKTHLDGKLKATDRGIMYIPAFQERFLPKEKWWTYNTDKGIDFNIGLADGDPTKGYPIVIGDAPVHGLCAGATGAGKSAFINQLLCTLCLKYPPSALELILIDFKNAEFPALKDNTTGISRIPHAKILAGTKDGEYIVSVFEYMLADMEERNRKFQEVGAKKVEEYNKTMRARGTPQECIPRTLLIIDEFQVMFTQTDGKVLDRIKVLLTNLAKLGRNAGVHLFMTSQSMSGTLGKDILDQFGFRFALRCSSDVSDALLGSKIASTITAKNGYGYSNTHGGQSQQSTTLWRVPYLDDPYWFSPEKLQILKDEGKAAPDAKCFLDILQDMRAERGEVDRKALYYDCSKKYGGEVLSQWLSDHHDLVDANPGLTVLGERTNYSTKKAPVHFMFRRSDGENAVIYAREDFDLCNLIRTLITSLKADPNNIVLANSADPDYCAMCELEELNGPNLAAMAHPSLSPVQWLEFLEGAIAGRKANGMEGKRPLYFFAVRWDKQMGIYRGDDYKLPDRWKTILMDGPSVDVHIILPMMSYRDISNSHMALFNHRICGQGDEDAGYKIIDSSKVSKLYEDGDAPVAVYKYGGDSDKFKIYQFTYRHQFSKRELDY